VIVLIDGQDGFEHEKDLLCHYSHELHQYQTEQRLLQLVLKIYQSTLIIFFLLVSEMLLLMQLNLCQKETFEEIIIEILIIF
jgi:hypothetical protein